MKLKTHQSPSALDHIFEAICAGTLGDLLLDSKVSAAAIAQWHADPANQAKLQHFKAAFEAQAQLMAAQARTRSILSLLALANNPASKPETIRKACSEVLRASAPPRPEPRQRAAKPSTAVRAAADQRDSDSESPAPIAAVPAVVEAAKPITAKPIPSIPLSGSSSEVRVINSAMDALPVSLADHASMMPIGAFGNSERFGDFTC